MSEKVGLLGAYKAIDEEKLKAVTDEDRKVVTEARAGVKQATLQKVAIFPIGMFLVYLGMLLYFRSRGGYKPVDASASAH
jgi:hypothetical protein